MGQGLALRAGRAPLVPSRLPRALPELPGDPMRKKLLILAGLAVLAYVVLVLGGGVHRGRRR